MEYCFKENQFDAALKLLQKEVPEFESKHKKLALNLLVLDLAMKCISEDPNECVLFVREKINPEIKTNVSLDISLTKNG